MAPSPPHVNTQQDSRCSLSEHSPSVSRSTTQKRSIVTAFGEVSTSCGPGLSCSLKLYLKPVVYGRITLCRTQPLFSDANL